MPWEYLVASYISIYRCISRRVPCFKIWVQVFCCCKKWWKSKYNYCKIMRGIGIQKGLKHDILWWTQLGLPAETLVGSDISRVCPETLLLTIHNQSPRSYQYEVLPSAPALLPPASGLQQDSLTSPQTTAPPQTLTSPETWTHHKEEPAKEHEKS